MKSIRRNISNIGMVFVLGLSGCLTPQTEAETQSSTILIDATSSGRNAVIEKQLLGVNAGWLDSGGGIIEFGEMIRDRSFRNQNKPGFRWLSSPNKGIGGQVKYVDTGGDANPISGEGYPGYAVLSQRAQGYTCISQQLLGDTYADEKYELHLSAKQLEGKPGLSVFLADDRFLPIEDLDNLSWVTGDWRDYEFTLEPTKDQAPGLLRICIVTDGSVAVDEVRMHAQGKTPQVRPLAKDRIRQLGIQSLRWPAGSDADYFDWKTSIGPANSRGENLSAFGDPQTPSWGLHEFLDFCETQGIVPLITVNIRKEPSHAAELVEYVLGSSSTPMGKVRSRNGRSQPWSVAYFELGNEPVDVYRDSYPVEASAKGYVKLATAVANAMRKKTTEIGKDIYLQAVLETTFAEADWIDVVPMLANWNATVLASQGGLLKNADHLKGNFYSAFDWHRSDKELFYEVMAGGTTLTQSIDNLKLEYGAKKPFWLTEYGVMVEKKHPSRILLEHAKDYQAGMGIADILISAINARFGGAYAFNLAEEGTWGMLANNVDFRLRPSGLAFSMISNLSGQSLLPLSFENVVDITARGGSGNNPKGQTFPALGAIAGRSEDEVQLILLNRNYEAEIDVSITIRGLETNNAQIEQLGPYETKDNNELEATAVSISTSAQGFRGAHNLLVPPRTLLRVIYR